MMSFEEVTIKDEPLAEYEDLDTDIAPTWMDSAQVTQTRPLLKAKSDDNHVFVKQTCEVCNKVLGHLGALRNHMNKMHPEVKPMSCNECKDLFYDKLNLRKHLLHSLRQARKFPNSNYKFDILCDRNYKLYCQICDKLFKVTHLFIAHTDRYHTEADKRKMKLQCGICSRVLSCPNSRRLHMLRVHGTECRTRGKMKQRRTVECGICSKALSRPDVLREHMLRVHSSQSDPQNLQSQKCVPSVKMEPSPQILQNNVSDAPKDELACNECHIQFNSRSELEAHITSSIKLARTVNRNSKFKYKFICDKNLCHTYCKICNEFFPSTYYITEHNRTIHNIDNRVLKAICKYCGKGYTTVKSLEIHERKHTGERPFICDICGKGLISKYSLDDHKQRHSDDTPFECDVCNKKFKLKSSLKDHRQIHFKEARIHECHICGYSHYSRTLLNYHIRTHSKERTFECSVCKKLLCTKRSLTVHMKNIHTQRLDPKICDVCGKEFTSYNSLKRHKNIHTGNRPHECSFCKKRFLVPHALQSHMIRKHKTLPYQCDTCGKRFKMKVDLNEHSYMHRNEQKP